MQDNGTGHIENRRGVWQIVDNMWTMAFFIFIFESM